MFSRSKEMCGEPNKWNENEMKWRHLRIVKGKRVSFAKSVMISLYVLYVHDVCNLMY